LAATALVVLGNVFTSNRVARNVFRVLVVMRDCTH